MDERTMHEQAVTQHLRILFKEVQAHSKAVEKECGLSSAKIWMLFEIKSKPGIKVSELANALFIHASTCSNMLDKLEDKGFILRDRSRKDQRAVHLHLTKEGSRILDKAPQPLQGNLSLALEQMPLELLTDLEKGLKGLVDVMQGGDKEAGMIPIPGDL